jgi:hypothetical protein
MRQLGVRPPEPPPAETDVQTSSEILPHERFESKTLEPVEVHRIELNSLDPEPAEQPQETVAADIPLPPEGANPVDPAPLPHDQEAMEAREPVQVYRLERTPAKMEPAERPRKRVAGDPHPGAPPRPARPRRDPVSFPDAAGRAAVGRWEEFNEFRHGEPRRGGRLHLEPMPVRQGPSSTLLTADMEREERRSSFLTLVVPAIAALLVIGALLWSGLLQYRVHQQNTAMNALQERNQKLTDMLAQMTGEQMRGEQKASGAPGSSVNTPQNPAAVAPPSATPAGGNSKAVTKPEKRQRENRQGVAAPPPVQQRGQPSVQQKGSQARRSSDAGYAPEIVPPYPTNFKSENVAVNEANRQPVPNAGTYHPSTTPGAAPSTAPGSTPGAPLTSSGANQQPVPTAGSDRPATSSSTSPRPTPPQASASSQSTVTPPSAKTTAPAAAQESATPAENATQYKANGNGAYASPLAQNIEAVEGLQRHSPVQLKEFHARAGASTQATRNVKLSVQHPDQGRGSYALVVSDGGSSQQLHGQVNRPLAFTDTATHREYALVVLSIADQQVYGYVRAKQ